MMGIRPLAVRRGLVWAAATVVWSCASTSEIDSSGSDVAAIVVTPPTSTMAVGAEVPLQAAVQDATGKTVSNVSVVWTVQDPKVASVSAVGVVKALAIGTTQVAANANGKSGIAAITVQKTPVASVVVRPNRIDATPGVKTQLTAIPYDAAQNELTERTITWTTSNALVATVDGNGMVTAVGGGTATITGTVEGKSDVSTVTVTQAPVTTVAVSPNPLLMSVGQTTTMSAIARDGNGNVVTGRPVTWASSDNSIATISDQGLLTAVAAGTTTITATSDGKIGTGSVTISNFAVGSVSVQPQTNSVAQGSSVQLTAVVRDVADQVTTNRVVTWSSSNANIATVSSTGIVTGVSAGAATITATSEGKSGSASVNVSPAPVATITISPPSGSVTAGQTLTLTATLKDVNGNILAGRTVAWSSSNTAAATVSNGVVTGVAPGTTTITASSEGRSATATVNVLAPVLAVGTVTVAPTTPSVMAGQTTTLAATVKDAAGTVVTNRVVTWTTSSSTVATVSGGVVTGVAPGNATITATSEGKSGSATVTVTPAPVATVAIATPPNVVIGTTSTLSVTVKDVNGTTVTDRPVTWSSSATNIATVTPQGGVVTGVALGSATITATSEGKSGTATVNVVPVPVASVTLSPSTATVIVGGATATLTPTVKDLNGTTVTNRVITWTSSDNAIATVANGVVTGVGPGTATITATSEGKSGSSTITVTLIPVASVTLSPTSTSVLKGQTVTLTPTVKDQNGTTVTNRPITWTSSDNAIATVANGVVTGVGVGFVTITATSEGKSGTSTVQVAVLAVGTVTVSPSTASVGVTQQTSLAATVKDINGNTVTDRLVTWSTPNPGVVQVSQSGVVTGITPGTAIVNATSEGKIGSATVTVFLLPVATVTVQPSSANVAVGSTTTLSATMKDLLGNTLSGRTVVWATSSSNIATVTQGGVVTGITPGDVTITATSEGKSGTATVSVTPAAVAAVSVQPTTVTITVGQTTTLAATPTDANGNALTGRAITWSSANTAIATVSNGVVTGVSPGAVGITATSEGKSGTATVTVTPVPVATITISPSPVSVKEDATVQLTATLRDANGNILTGRTVTWSSNNNTIATVNQTTGVLLGKKQGTTTVTAASEGRTSTVSVTVTK